VKNCKNCGFQLKEDDDFCGECGTAVKKEPIAEKICKSCGNILDDGLFFCNKCGKRYEAPAPPPPPPLPAPNKYAKYNQYSQSNHGSGNSPAYYQQNNDSARFVLLCAVCALFGIVMIVGLIMYISGFYSPDILPFGAVITSVGAVGLSFLFKRKSGILSGVRFFFFSLSRILIATGLMFFIGLLGVGEYFSIAFIIGAGISAVGIGGVFIEKNCGKIK
jgi:RNA polymerase subunit RPABC4/transcription elongation factor Spt4